MRKCCRISVLYWIMKIFENLHFNCQKKLFDNFNGNDTFLLKYEYFLIFKFYTITNNINIIIFGTHIWYTLWCNVSIELYMHIYEIHISCKAFYPWRFLKAEHFTHVSYKTYIFLYQRQYSVYNKVKMYKCRICEI